MLGIMSAPTMDRVLLVASLVAGTLALAARDGDDGPAEQAGEQMDEAAEQVQDTAQEAGDELEQATD